MKNEEVSDNSSYKLVLNWQGYENLEICQHAFLTSDYKVITTKKILYLRFIIKVSTKKTVILEEDPGLIKSKLEIKKVKLLTRTK